MIKPISKIEAFELLLNKDTASKVYVKKLGTADYLQAENHRFSFGNSDRAINVYLADFYVEDQKLDGYFIHYGDVEHSSVEEREAE